MRYSDNIDYLLASIVYLGTHTYWWARSPQSMAGELQLDERRLQDVFNGFPGMFRKSVRTDSKTRQHYYALQARYTQREGGEVKDPETQSYIEPLDPSSLEVIIGFVLKMAEQESREADQKLRRVEQRLGNFVAVGAAIIAAGAAIVAAVIHH